MGELGDRLREAREAKGLTFEQIEETTRIRRRYLQALEEEDYGQLPGDVFVRGFLRNYALALGMDPEEVLAASGRKIPSPIPPTLEPQEEILDEPLVAPGTSQRMIAVAIGVMVVIALGLGSWTLYRIFGPGSAPPAPTATLTPPSATPSKAVLVAPVGAVGTPAARPSPTMVAATAVPATGVFLRLEATDYVWLRVTLDGRTAYEGFIEAGQVQEWQAEAEAVLRTGNAGGMRVWYNGQEEPPLGAPGEVVEQTYAAGELPADIGAPAPFEESTPGPLGPPPSSPTPTPFVPTVAPTAESG